MFDQRNQPLLNVSSLKPGEVTLFIKMIDAKIEKCFGSALLFANTSMEECNLVLKTK